jgi:hypothetical protein
VSILAVRTAPSMQQGQLVMWNSHWPACEWAAANEYFDS